MNQPAEMEVRPAAPVEIPQVQGFLALPQEWLTRAISMNVSVAHCLERWVTGGNSGRIRPYLSECHLEVFASWEARFGAEACAALAAADCQVCFTVSRDLWELFILAASNVGKSGSYVAVVLVAEAMRFEKEHGKELRELSAEIRKEAARESAGKPAVPGRVIPGPWKPGGARRAKAKVFSGPV